MSSKFKVGDRVRDITDENNEEAIVIATQGATIKVEWTLDNELLVNPNGNRFWPEDDFELVTPADTYQSPVKERVVKEIQAGDYHKVCVEYSRDGKNDLRVFTNLFVNPSAQDLRHAARVFNELAEVLEGNKDA